MIEMFKGRKLLIATMHQKEKVIAPLLEKYLGVECVVAENFDSDSFGTFTGENARKDSALETAKQKCLAALNQNDFDLGLASEGSFGAHPFVFFANADDEFMVFIDIKNKLEIIIRELSLETNFNAKVISDKKELLEFAESIKFPSHGLILRKSKDENIGIVKGITDELTLASVFDELIQKYGAVYAETDMRAMHNPMRMKVIEKATYKLIEKINNCCPDCNTPGFGVTEVNQGLPCSLCGMATRSTLSFEYTCSKCSFVNVEMYPHQKQFEDPMYCDYCNP
jgi:hypothetical protein